MGLTAKEEGQKREPVAEGAHHSVCFAIVDLGTQPPLPGSQFSKRQHKVLFMWELPDEEIEVEREGVPVMVPRVISKDFPVSLHEKANLRKFLTAWRGRQFTEEELKGFALKNVLGANCVLNMVHEHKNGRVYANIASVMPLMKGAQKRTPKTPPLVFDLDEHPAGASLPDSLPQWVQERIARSDEWQDRSQNGHAAHSEPPPNGGDDDPIPF
jgi:hypothetical protein